MLTRNIRASLPTIRRDLHFSIVVALTLALGIGANTAMFSVIYGVLLAPLPYLNPDQLVMVWARNQSGKDNVSVGDFLEWQRLNTVFQKLVAWSDDYYNFRVSDQPERIVGRAQSPGVFQMMGTNLFLGRDFLPEEAEVGKEQEVILTYRLWNRLGADRNIVGKHLVINRGSYTVVGVTSPGRIDRQEPQLFVPLAFRPEQMNHDYRWLMVMGRMKSDISIRQAQADMDLTTGQLMRGYPLTNQGWSSVVESLRASLVPQDRRRVLWLLLGAVLAVLLISCVNVANLVLVKGTTRLKEVAVRTSLGASSWNIFSQFLVESMLLACLGGILGIALGWVLLRVVVANLPSGLIPREAEISFNLPVLLFAMVTTSLAGMGSGCIPAWHLARLDPGRTLKEAGHTVSGNIRQRMHRFLVVCEFALALILLAGAGLAIHSFWKLTKIDLGIRTDHLLTFGLASPQEDPAVASHVVNFYQRVLDSISAQPGVAQAEIATGMPVEGGGFTMPFTVAEHSAVDPATRPTAVFQMVSSGYYPTLGIQIVEGRRFDDQDIETAPRVAVVNEVFARRFLTGDPLKHRIRVEQLIPGQSRLGPPLEWQIVGVAKNFHNVGIRDDQFPEIDVPFRQSPWPHVAVVVRTSVDPDAMSKTIAAAVHRIDNDAVLEQISTLDQIVDAMQAGDRFAGLLYGSFASVALLLAIVGIYGVTAFSVTQRTKEMGVRIALGASRRHISVMIVKEGLILVSLGLAVGLAGSFAMARLLRGLLYGIGAIDAQALGVVSLILVLAGMSACYLPARRAASADPIVALHYD
jgi:putative ABC transport system permease protein